MNPFPAPAQTPQSQYLAAALKQLSAAQPATPAALGMDLGASALMQMAQHRNEQRGPANGALAQSLAGAGSPLGQSAALPPIAPKPFSGLMSLGKMFGGSGG